MKIYKLTATGDELLAEVSIVEEAEKILREYRDKGCFVTTGNGDDIVLKEPLPDEAFIIWPMAGG